jgi:hypothetical protein
LETLKVADVEDRIGAAAETIYQTLTEVELTAVIGRPHERPRVAQRNGPGSRLLTPPPLRRQMPSHVGMHYHCRDCSEA